MSTRIIHLASASPRRSALLRQIGVAHRVAPVHIDERVVRGETPPDYVRRLSAAKARTLQERLPEGELTLGADTCVALDDEIFGKPESEADCVRILTRLGGRTHCVHTAVTLSDGVRSNTVLNTSEVEFRRITQAESVAYWRSGEPRDKAGAYAIQGRAAVFVRSIRGSYSGIVGLPLFETAQLLADAGILTTSLLAEAAA